MALTVVTPQLQGNLTNMPESDNPTKIDPWGQTKIQNYDRLMSQFGVKSLSKLKNKFPVTHRFLRREIIFGHRDIENILNAIENKQPWAVLSGIKPTGEFHFGSLTTATEIVYFQKLGGKAFYCIADWEAYEDNGISPEDSLDTAVNNVADILALGLDPKTAFIYRQTQEPRVNKTAFKAARNVTFATLKAIYGIRNLGLYMASMIQVGDILLPQHKDFGGPKPSVIPVGIDQDPHIRLTRDLALKLGYQLPSATLHKLALGLDGSQKMGKRDPMSYFTFYEPMNSIRKKFMNAFTGGRITAQEQRELGGIPGICPIYNMGQYHLYEEDQDLQKMYDDCTSGTLLCGECKQIRFKVLSNLIEIHRKKRDKKIDKAKQILQLD